MNDTIDCADSSPRLKAGASSAFCGDQTSSNVSAKSFDDRLKEKVSSLSECGR